MKSFASIILAAVVSANYCYEDGCNCNGEARACYSLPRQNMRPAVNTCCAEGDMPTIYGIDNGRSINIAPVTDSLVATCAETFQASNCSSVHYSQRQACEKNRADARTLCEKTSADERTEAEKADADERKEAEKSAADERKEAEKSDADERKEAEKSAADERKEAEKAQWTNLMALDGAESSTWSPTASLAWNADKCSAYCGTFGSYPPTKCERYGPCVAEEEATPVAATTNLLSQQKKDYMSQQKSALGWSNSDCSQWCFVYGSYPPTKCTSMPLCEAQTASLKKDGNWNNNEFTGANVQTGGNTNCVKGCGIEVNLNGL